MRILTVPVKSVVTAAEEIMKPHNADRYFQNDDATVDLVIDEPAVPVDEELRRLRNEIDDLRAYAEACRKWMTKSPIPR